MREKRGFIYRERDGVYSVDRILVSATVESRMWAPVSVL